MKEIISNSILHKIKPVLRNFFMQGYLPQDLYTICCQDFGEAGHYD